jgi:TonB family protein
MPRDVRFWRNVAFIGLAHVIVIGGVIRWSREAKPPAPAQSVVWMNGGAGDGDAGPVESPAAPVQTVSLTTPLPEPEMVPTVPPDEEDRAVATSAPSEIQLPTPEPSATPTPPKPRPSPIVKATPKPTRKSSPQPTPKPTPKATPKTKPKPKPTPSKVIVAKATPKPSPKIKPAPAESEAEQEVPHVESEKKLAAPEKDSMPKKLVVAQGSNGKRASAGGGGHAGGAGGESQFGWYGSMLHDRFYSEWVQPTTGLVAGSKASALVKIRIEKDGRVSSFEIIRPSGNPVIDDSITAAAKRVIQVDPLPAGLGNGEHYDVKINFELSADQ